jgi:hypothetical protein
VIVASESSMRTSVSVTFDTRTDTTAAVAVRPDASRAMAVMACDPSLAAFVSQLTEYGAVVSSGPRFAPSTTN